MATNELQLEGGNESSVNPFTSSLITNFGPRMTVFLDASGISDDEVFEIRKNMDDLVSTFGIETIDMKLPLRMDDLDNIEKGLNSIIGTLDGDKLRLTGTSAERQQLDQFMKVHTYITNELNRRGSFSLLI